MQIVRQGDVVLIEVPTGVPATATLLTRENGLVVLAHGEVTGHHHAIAEPGVELFAAGEASALADRYLRTGDAGGTLTHQEHATIPLARNTTFIVRRQREYRPEEIVRVAD